MKIYITWSDPCTKIVYWPVPRFGKCLSVSKFNRWTVVWETRFWTVMGLKRWLYDDNRGTPSAPLSRTLPVHGTGSRTSIIHRLGPKLGD